MPSKIQWTDETLNVVTGCTQISAGCKNCYAKKMHGRLALMGQAKYSTPFSVVRCHPDAIDIVKRWRKPRKIFVCSMSDLFHKDVPWKFIARVFDVIDAEKRHTFQVLTKRPERMARFIEARNREGYPTPPNAWLGTSVEDQAATGRINHLVLASASVRFLSVEPLLGHVDLGSLARISWVVVGGESGPRCRPMKAAWARSIRDQCQAQGVAFFFKQWGGVRKTEDRELDGREWNEMPDPLLDGDQGQGLLFD